MIRRSRCVPIISGLGSPNPNNHSRKRQRVSANVRAWRLGMFNQSDNRKYPSKRMKGEALIMTVETHVVVANKNAASLSGTFGSNVQASVTHAAITRTKKNPAPQTARHSNSTGSFHASLASV